MSPYLPIRSVRLARSIRSLAALAALVLLAEVSVGQQGGSKVPKSGKPDAVPVVAEVADANAIRALDAKAQFVVWSGDTPDGQKPSISVWDFNQNKKLPPLRGHDGRVTHVVVVDIVYQVVSAGEDKTVRLWDIRSGKELAKFAHHPSKITSIAYSNFGEKLITGSTDKFIRIFDVKLARETQRLDAHDSGEIIVAANRKNMLSGTGADQASNYDLRYWNLPEGKEVFRLKGHTGPIISIDLSIDGKRAISASKDGTVRIWDLEKRKEERRLEGHSDVRHVKFGNEALALTTGGSVWRIWDVPTGKLIVAKAIKNRKVDAVASHLFSKGHVVSAGEGLVQVWDLRAALTRIPWMASRVASSIHRRDGAKPSLGLGLPSEAENAPPGAELPPMIRELFRQSLLISARDEMQLLTRDAFLGESLPPAAGSAKPLASLDFLINWSFNNYWLEIAERIDGKPQKSLWTHQGAGRLITQDALISRIEALSRTEFPAALQKAGFSRPRNGGKTTNEALPPSVASRLQQMDYMSQFAAVRELHAVIDEKGESVDLLGGLVRGYAMLGVLTEMHWSASHKAFKARALLYAERLENLAPKSPNASWHKAYAAAMAGMHWLALHHISEVKKADPKASPPEWVDLIDAYCRFDEKRLDERARERHGALAGLLLFIVKESGAPHADLMRTGIAYAKSNPECYRVLDTIGRDGALTYGSMGFAHASRTMNQSVGRRIGEMRPPQSLAERLKAAIIDPQNEEPALISAMRNIPDDGEATWGMLGDLIQQTRFLHLWRRVEFARHVLAVPVEPNLIESSRRHVGNHPFFIFVENYSKSDLSGRPALLEWVRKVRFSDLNFSTHIRFFLALQGLVPEHAGGYLRRSMGTPDYSYPDLMALAIYASGVNPKEMTKLLFVSPHSPLARAKAIERNWDLFQDKAPTWEKDGHSVVLVALGRRYVKSGADARAIECYESAIKKGVDRIAFSELAAIYKRQKQEEKWLATMTASLNIAASGLGRARIQVDIAEHYMSRKEWEKARPYVDEAAQTGSAWAMQAACRCHTALEEWEKAEAYASATSQRYQADVFDWFIWCRQTGRGNVDEARKLVEDRIRFDGQPVSIAKESAAGRFFVLAEKNTEAIKYLESVLMRAEIEAVRIELAIAADRVGNKVLRDRTLRGFRNQPGSIAELARILTETYATNGKISTEKIDGLLKMTSEDRKIQTSIYAGIFLLQNDQSADAVRYLDRPVGARIHHVLALGQVALRKTRVK